MALSIEKNVEKVPALEKVTPAVFSRVTRKIFPSSGSTLYSGLELEFTRKWDTNWIQSEIQISPKSPINHCYYLGLIPISMPVTRATSLKCFA